MLNMGFKNKITALVHKRKVDDFASIEKLHTDVIVAIANLFTPALYAILFAKIEKEFRHTYNHPERDKETEVNETLDFMRLIAGEMDFQYLNLRKKKDKPKIKYEFNWIKIREEIVLDVECCWNPSFTGYEQFQAGLPTATQVNTMPNVWLDVRKQLNGNSLKFISCHSADGKLSIRFEVDQ